MASTWIGQHRRGQPLAGGETSRGGGREASMRAGIPSLMLALRLDLYVAAFPGIPAGARHLRPTSVATSQTQPGECADTSPVSRHQIRGGIRGGLGDDEFFRRAADQGLRLLLARGAGQRGGPDAAAGWGPERGRVTAGVGEGVAPAGGRGLGSYGARHGAALEWSRRVHWGSGQGRGEEEAVAVGCCRHSGGISRRACRSPWRRLWRGLRGARGILKGSVVIDGGCGSSTVEGSRSDSSGEIPRPPKCPTAAPR
jgi:hypothetical protein